MAEIELIKGMRLGIPFVHSIKDNVPHLILYKIRYICYMVSRLDFSWELLYLTESLR